MTKRLGLMIGIPLLPLLFVAGWLALSQSSSSSAQSAALQLAIPVKCEIGRSCLVQKLVDHDASSGRRDFRCGTLTTDGHDGVDIRLRTMDEMQSGYAVLASAAGTVRRTRDGEPDTGSGDTVALNGKDAGNGVVIDHGDNWETQYSHLRKDSIQVKPGQQIVAGQQLGLIGLSGNTEFPHLHFTVRHRGVAIDPFTGAIQGSACSASNSPVGLWTSEASRTLSYVPTAIISIGLSSRVPARSTMDRSSERQQIERQAPILLWADVIGAETGDIQHFTITGPDERPVHAQQIIVSGGGLSWLAFSGKRTPESGWPTGRYVGRYAIWRNGKNISEANTSAAIE